MAPDVLVAGECLVDFIPDRPGPLSAVERFDRRAGGAPANVAVRLAELGPAPWLWTRLGNDPFGAFLAETLADHGLPDRFVVRDAAAKTTLAFVAHDDDADRSFTFYRDGTADTRLEPGTVPDGTLEGIEWVAVGGVALSAEPARTATLDLAARAREHGCGVFFDPNARPELWTGEDYADALAATCERATVVKATPEDLALAGIEGSPAELLETMLELGPHTAMLTRGEAGAIARATEVAPWGPAEASHGGYAVDAVDATGAGDAFVAGALRALADGESLAAALAAANATAAVATTSEGAMSAPVDREAVDRLRNR